MKAIITVQMWVDVGSVDEAAMLVQECEKTNRLNLVSVLEQRGATAEDLVGKMGYFGTSFWMLDEEKVGIE